MSPRWVAVALVTVAAFADLLAYSIAVPVLPDLGHRLGASPTLIGLLFGAFGATLLTTSIPMGAISDRIGRKGPLVGGMAALSLSTLLFAYAQHLPLLFAARLVQGAADAVTWVVGFALIADLYGPDERGRVMGLVMSGTGLGLMMGPALGGWLYELGGTQLPFLTVTALTGITAMAFAALRLPDSHVDRDHVPVAAVVTRPEIAAIASAVALAARTISMLEPVLPLFLSSAFGLGPARIGLVFGAGALVSTLLHPLCGRLTDRLGGRTPTLVGLVLMALAVTALSRAWSATSALALYLVLASTTAIVVTPSLAYMAEATSSAGLGSFGVAYGLYNVAWGIGLLAGPSMGGFLYERIGFARLTLGWAPLVVLVTLAVARVARPTSSIATPPAPHRAA